MDPMEGFGGGMGGGGGMNIDPEILMQMFGGQMGGGGGGGGFHSFGGGGMPGGGRQRGAPQGFPGGFSFQWDSKSEEETEGSDHQARETDDDKKTDRRKDRSHNLMREGFTDARLSQYRKAGMVFLFLAVFLPFEILVILAIICAIGTICFSGFGRIKQMVHWKILRSRGSHNVRSSITAYSLHGVSCLIDK